MSAKYECNINYIALKFDRVNPYEELTMEPITDVIEYCQLDSVVFTATKSLFVFGSITSLLPWPEGYYHHIGI